MLLFFVFKKYETWPKLEIHQRFTECWRSVEGSCNRGGNNVVSGVIGWMIDLFENTHSLVVDTKWISCCCCWWWWWRWRFALESIDEDSDRLGRIEAEMDCAPVAFQPADVGARSVLQRQIEMAQVGVGRVQRTRASVLQFCVCASQNPISSNSTRKRPSNVQPLDWLMQNS